MKEADKPKIVEPIRELANLGFKILATRGTVRYLEANGIACTKINKVLEGRPNIVDSMKNREVDLVFNTTEGAKALADSSTIRRTALMYKIPYYTTIAGALAAARAIKAMRAGSLKFSPCRNISPKMCEPVPDSAPGA